MTTVDTHNLLPVESNARLIRYLFVAKTSWPLLKVKS